MTILLIGIGAVHCLVLLVLVTELVLERRHNAALSDRNAMQANALAMWQAKFPGRRLVEVLPESREDGSSSRPFGLGPEHFEDRN